MSSKHQEFARQVLEAFAAAGCHTDKEVAEMGGPSSTTMTMLRKAAVDGSEFPKLRSDTLRRIDRAAMWLSNGARDLWLNGTAPTTQTRYPSPLTGEVGPRQPKGRQYGIEGYVEMLAERVLELEERVDLLEMGQQQKEGTDRGTSAEKSDDDPNEGNEGGKVTPLIPKSPKGGGGAAEDLPVPDRIASRTGKSTGRGKRKAQDDAATESQEDPNADPGGI